MTNTKIRADRDAWKRRAESAPTLGLGWRKAGPMTTPKTTADALPPWAEILDAIQKLRAERDFWRSRCGDWKGLYYAYARAYARARADLKTTKPHRG